MKTPTPPKKPQPLPQTLVSEAIGPSRPARPMANSATSSEMPTVKVKKM